MNGTFFQEAFSRENIVVVTPTEEKKQYVGSKIERELEYGKILPETKETFRKIAERMIAEEGIQAVVLGCTELPLIFSTIELPVPYLDVMHIHIDALIDLAAKH